MKRLVAIIVVLICVSGGFWLLYRANNRSVSEAHADFLKIADKNPGYERIFADINKARHPGTTKFCVNTAFVPGCANVIIVDRTKRGALTNKNEIAIVGDLEDNALAFPPNLILIDKNLISHLVFETYNIVLATARSIGQRGASISGLRTELTLASIADSDVVRTGKISAVFFGEDANLGDFSGKLVWDFAQPQKSDDEYNGLVETYFEASLILLLEHESAHLRLKKGLFGADPFASSAHGPEAALTLIEENRADEAALASMKSYIAYQKKSKDPVIAQWFQNPVLSSIPFLVEAEYWRDKALVKGLEGFRNFSTNDFAIEVAHNECDPESPQSLSYLDPVGIRAARRKPLPLLTQVEFDKQRAVFAKADTPQTHTHDLLRAEKIYAALGKMANGALLPLTLDGHANFVTALLANKPEMAFPSSRGFKLIPHSDLNAFIAKTSGYVKYDAAVTCPLARCYVGKIDNDDGYIEVVGSATEIAEVRIIMNLGTGLGQDESENSKYIENMAKYMAVMLALSQPGSTEAIGFAAFLRQGLFRCGAASTFLVDPATNIAYHSTTLERPGFIQVRMFNIDSADDF